MSAEMAQPTVNDRPSSKRRGRCIQSKRVSKYNSAKAVRRIRVRRRDADHSFVSKGSGLRG